MVVVLLVGALLAIVIPRFYRQATNTVDGARLIGNFQYVAQAIGSYATDYGRYPTQLAGLNAGGYKYLPEVSISGNTITLDGLDYNYVPSDSACGGGASLFVSGLSADAYNEVKSYIGSAIKWRFDDASKTIKLCL
jgi:type II secretory pathway pseudopilin PulG